VFLAILVSAATSMTARAADGVGRAMSGTLPELRPELQPAAERLYVA
jgi:hypothetical protein